MARTACLLLLAAAAAAGEDEPNRWEAALRETVAKCDRIRVRSGGTCHRRPERDRTLFEVRDAGKIESTVRAIRIAPHAGSRASGARTPPSPRAAPKRSAGGSPGTASPVP